MSLKFYNNGQMTSLCNPERKSVQSETYPKWIMSALIFILVMVCFFLGAESVTANPIVHYNMVSHQCVAIESEGVCTACPDDVDALLGYTWNPVSKYATVDDFSCSMN